MPTIAWLFVVLTIPATPDRREAPRCDDPACDPCARDAGPLVPVAWAGAVTRSVARDEYSFASVAPGVHSAPNRAHGLRSVVHAEGIDLLVRDASQIGPTTEWELELRTRSIGCAGASAPLDEPLVLAQRDRVELWRERFVEWYVNDERGIEQGWTISAAPDGSESAPIRIELEVRGLEPSVDPDGRCARFADADGTARVLYTGLRAWDATGCELVARLVASERRLAIEVDASGASYPLTIDPVLEGPTWTGECDQAGAAFGYSVAGAGDVNGDGFDDVIVGAWNFDNGQTDEGRAYLYMGSAIGLSTTPAWTAEGDQADAKFGNSVAAAGDVDADGFDDVVVGAYAFSNGQLYEGRVFLYMGSASGLSATSAWIAECDQAGAGFGWSVSSTGDVNGDGFDDVIVGAPFLDNGQTDEGRAFVYMGSASGLAATSTWSAESDQAAAQFAIRVSSAGDVDGDGFDDVVIGAHVYDGGLLDEGRAYLYRGSAAGLSPTSAWTAECNQQNARFGWSVSGAGDVDGDGFDDVIVGAPFFDGPQFNDGRAFLYAGSATGLSASPAWSAGGTQSGALSSYSVSGAGDIDGDGYDDVIVGAYHFDVAYVDEGRAFAYLGSATGLSPTTSWSSEGGGGADAHLGHAVARAGDVDGDGLDDAIVGAALSSNGQSHEGRAFVFRGHALIVEPFCFGDGSGAPCPCGNTGASGNGCASSVNPAGAHLGWAGAASIAADTFVLQGSGMPEGAALYFQAGAPETPVPGPAFGDGVRCASGTLVRLGTKLNSGGASQYPVAGDLPISIRGMNSASSVRSYQVWYRNAASFCTTYTFNFSNGLEVRWLP